MTTSRGRQNCQCSLSIGAPWSLQIDLACRTLHDTTKPAADEHSSASSSPSARRGDHLAIDRIDDCSRSSSCDNRMEPSSIAFIHPLVSRYQLAAHLAQRTSLNHIGNNFGMVGVACPIGKVAKG